MKSSIIKYQLITYKIVAPSPVKPLVSPGDSVQFNEKIFKSTQHSEEIIFNISSFSGKTNPGELDNVLKVSCGEIFPLYTSLLDNRSLSSIVRAISPFYGYIEKIILPTGIAISKKLIGDKIEINIFDPLEVKKNKINKYLKVKQGQVIRRGDVLAEKLLSDGITTYNVISPVNGNIIKIENGIITIDIKEKYEIIRTKIPGRVTSIEETPLGSSAIIEGRGVLVKGLHAIGKPIEGHLEFIESNPEKNLMSDKKNIFKNSILVINQPVDENILSLSLKTGVKGIISPSQKIFNKIKNYSEKKYRDISILSLFYSGVEKLPKFLVDFFELHKAQWCMLTINIENIPNALFLPTPLKIFYKPKSHLFDIGDCVLILTGKKKNKFGYIKSIQPHIQKKDSSPYIPLAEVIPENENESILIPVNDLYL